MTNRTEVVRDPAIMSSEPTVSGTRILATTILGYLRRGSSAEEIFRDYPSLPVDGIDAVRRWAEAMYGVDWKTPDMPPFSLEHYELDRDPDETDEEYAARRAMFEGIGRTSDRGSSECDEDRRFEILDGVGTPLEDATENHEQIVMNIVGALKPAMDRIGCRTYVRMAVRRGDSSPVTELRPDILVRRGPVGDRTYVDDPIVVIEVMSPGSKPRNERLKHSFYRDMPTVRHIVLVDAERLTVQHDVRTERGYDRSILTDPEAVIDLTAVGFSISLEEVYSGVILGLAPAVREAPSMAVPREHRMEGAEFRAFQAIRPDHERWELVGGVAIQTGRPTILHNHLASNLDRLLNERIERYAPSLIATQRLGIDFGADDCKPEPDVAVVDANYAPDQRFVERAYLLAEVVSDEDQITVPGSDRKWIDVKRELYRSHPHCEAVLVVAADQVRVELELRTEAGWTSSVLESGDAELVVPSVGVRFFLNELYEGTPLRRRGTSQ